MSGESQYGYDEEYQCKVVALILRDPSFLHSYSDVADPSYFDYEQLSTIARMGLEFYKKAGTLPTRESMRQEYAEHCQRYRIPDPEPVLVKIDEVFHANLADGPAIQQRVVDFGRRQALRTATLGIINLLKNPENDLDNAQDLVLRALNVGTGAHDLGGMFHAGLPSLPQRLREGFYNRKNKIATGMPTLDEATFGGPGIGEVWMCLAKSGIGKSTWCVHVGLQAIAQGHPVLHVTIADLHQEDVEMRYAQRATGCTAHDVINNSPTYAKRAAIVAKVNQYLRIKYYAAGKADIGTIRSYLTQVWSMDGVRPKVLILDYPDKLKGAADGDSTYLGMGRVMDGLNAIANDFGLLVWAPSQVTRYAPSGDDDVITGDNIQDSKRKIDDCDGAISLNQTAVEYRKGRVRLWVDKVRRGRCKFVVNLHDERDKMILREAIQ
jgi:replicative DNA helicase